MTSLSFGPECRLLQASEFQQVFDHTCCKVHQPAFLLLASPAPCARIGFVVAKRKIRRAHERNRLKRLARESFRLNRHLLPALDIVLMAKAEAQTLPNAELHQQLSTAWQQLARRAGKRAAARDG